MSDEPEQEFDIVVPYKPKVKETYALIKPDELAALRRQVEALTRERDELRKYSDKLFLRSERTEARAQAAESALAALRKGIDEAINFDEPVSNPVHANIYMVAALRKLLSTGNSGAGVLTEFKKEA